MGVGWVHYSCDSFFSSTYVVQYLELVDCASRCIDVVVLTPPKMKLHDGGKYSPKLPILFILMHTQLSRNGSRQP